MTHMKLETPQGYAGTGKDQNCGIIALAYLTGLPYAEVEDYVWADRLKHYPTRAKSRERWKGRMWARVQYHRILGDLGIAFELANMNRKGKVATLVDWEILKAGVTYTIGFRGHVVTYLDGWVMDQDGVKKLEKTRSNRCFVKWFIPHPQKEN